jgi:copper homeostasis protein CutC
VGFGQLGLQDLLEGGLTPTSGTLKVARGRLRIKIMAMVRPRGGDFCYSDVEFAVMREDLLAAKALGADGIVLGLLAPDGTVDRARTAELVALARPLPVTFHRAFDMTRDPFEALDALIDLGLDRVLTSGQEPSVVEGLPLISELVRRAAGRARAAAEAGDRQHVAKSWEMIECQKHVPSRFSKQGVVEDPAAHASRIVNFPRQPAEFFLCRLPPGSHLQ